MKRSFFIAVALVATMTAKAQNIAVVSPGNETTMYQTLGEAVTKAANGSVIYLPGGGFQIPDSIKINKPLTIMGVSHRGDTDNVDGATVISGNLNFGENSSGSAVVGVFVSGEILIGYDGSSVNNITIRLCNVKGIKVKSNICTGIIVNQNYIRGLSNFGQTNATITNNITSGMIGINGGTVLNNIFAKNEKVDSYESRVLDINNSTISYNVFLATNVYSNGRTFWNGQINGENNQGISNMTKGYDWGDDCKDIGGVEWTDVFDKSAGVSLMSNYHFKGDYEQYEGKIGLYGGSGFKDGADAHAPIPRIVSKKIDEQTDGSGRLHIQVTIKAQ